MSHTFEVIDKKTAVVRVAPEISTGKMDTVNGLRDLCRELEMKGVVHLVMDFSDVQHCPSVVFGNILVGQKRLAAAGGGILLTGFSPYVAKTARIIGMNRDVNSFENVESALDSLKPQ